MSEKQPALPAIAAISADDDARDPAQRLQRRYQDVRRFSDLLCRPLQPEDCVIQSMPDVSPTRWHLAHTTWFFETFALARSDRGYRPVRPEFEYLFNSYYNSVGEQFPRPQRGLLSRPTVAEVFDYRRAVDERMEELFELLRENTDAMLLETIEIGLHHEQQHQELMLTDIKHVFSCNPLYPAYHGRLAGGTRQPPPLKWLGRDEDLCWIGHDGDGFAYDNESPRHRVLVHAHQIASRLATCGEYLQFIDDGGYRRPELWLSDGWSAVQQHNWQAPLYWRRREGGGWDEFTLSGLQPLDLHKPVCHVSYFEADAFARWADARLPTEAEWEASAEPLPLAGTFVDSGLLHPQAASTTADDAPVQMFGDVWQWTASAYTAYPGYQAPAGALGEYNGKFMCNQFVLRGGSCATSRSHIRAAYRNFFPPEARWQFSGIRLAR